MIDFYCFWWLLWFKFSGFISSIFAVLFVYCLFEIVYTFIFLLYQELIKLDDLLTETLLDFNILSVCRFKLSIPFQIFFYLSFTLHLCSVELLSFLLIFFIQLFSLLLESLLYISFYFTKLLIPSVCVILFQIGLILFWFPNLFKLLLNFVLKLLPFQLLSFNLTSIVYLFALVFHYFWLKLKNLCLKGHLGFL